MKLIFNYILISFLILNNNFELKAGAKGKLITTQEDDLNSQNSLIYENISTNVNCSANSLIEEQSADQWFEIKEIIQQISCPYAKKSYFWESNFCWNQDVNVATNMEEFKEEFKKFVINLQLKQKDGYDSIFLVVPEEVVAEEGEHIFGFAKFFNKLLMTLNPKCIKEIENIQHDDEGVYWADQENPWEFSFNGERFFIVTLAPFYDSRSSRYNFGSNQFFILFQLSRSFPLILNKIGSTQEHKLKQKQMVRNVFSRRGQQYEMSKSIESPENYLHGKKTHEASRYIKPLHDKGGVQNDIIPWWNLDKLNELEHQYRQDERMDFMFSSIRERTNG